MTPELPTPAHRPPVTASGRQRAAFTDSIRCRLDDTGVLAVTGGDAASFLHGQFSSDVTALLPGDAALTSYSDARGRVLAAPRLFVGLEGFLLALPAERVAPVRQQLMKYVLRADVRIEDRSADYRCLGLAGAEAALAGYVEHLPTAPGQTAALPDGGILLRPHGARPRWLACGPAAALERLWQALDHTVVDADADAWRLLEVEAGVPTVYTATAGHFVAQMLNLDRLGTLDFHKGCYPGQEVIARTHYLGHIKRRMHVLRSESGAPPQPGATVYAAGEVAGEIVDAAPHPDGGSLALAVLRLEADQGALSLETSDGPPATAAPPPYGLSDAD